MTNRGFNPEFERLVEFVAAYDKRDPDPRKNYGIHGVELRMVLKGSEGATQFALSTGWYLPETIGSTAGDWGIHGRYAEHLTAHSLRSYHPSPSDLGYHSRRAMYDGQETISDSCEYLDGAPCFYDGSGLNAWRPFEALLREGHEGVWKVLEDYYVETFAEVMSGV